MMKKNEKWTLKEQAEFLKRLSELLSHGYSFTQAVEFLQLQLREELQFELERTLKMLKEGESLYNLFTALEFHPHILSYLYFAENHGDLANTLSEGSDMLLRRIQHTEKFKKMLRYPLFLLVFVGIMLVIIEKQLLPQFQSMYDSMNAKSSFFTTLLLNLSLFNRLIFSSILLILVSGCIYYFFHYRHLPASSQMDVLLKIPVVKSYCTLLNSHFFSLQLSNLLKGGLSIYQSLLLFTQQGHSRFFNEEADEINRLLRTGERLDVIINERNYYEKELSLIIYHGQSNGDMAKELYRYSQ